MFEMRHQKITNFYQKNLSLKMTLCFQAFYYKSVHKSSVYAIIKYVGSNIQKKCTRRPQKLRKAMKRMYWGICCASSKSITVAEGFYTTFKLIAQF